MAKPVPLPFILPKSALAASIELIPVERFSSFPMPAVRSMTELAPLGIVHFQDAGLGERVGCPVLVVGWSRRTGWDGIAFDLDGPAVVAGDEQALGDACNFPTGRVLFGDAGDAALRVGPVGSELFLRPAAATGQG